MSEIVVETIPSETVIVIQGGPELTTTVATELQTVVETPAEPVVIDLNSGARGEPGSAILTGPAYPTLLDGSIGDVYIITEGNTGAGDVYEKTDAGWVKTGNIRGPAGGVDSVNGYTGPNVVLVRGDIGLANVDNTSDLNKPISTATQTALNTLTSTKLSKTETYWAGHHPEGRVIANAFFTNDLGNLRLRSGGSYTISGSKTISNFDFDKMFDGTADHWACGTLTAPVTLELTLPKVLTFSAYLGIGFGAPNWAPQTVRIEAFSEGVWKDVINTTTNTAEEIYAPIPGNAGVGTTKVRVTLDNGTGVRVAHIWGFNYNSDMWSQVTMPRKGGAFYGSISVPQGVINVPTPTATTDAANKLYVDTKVSLTGNETIAGIKTFSGVITANEDINLIGKTVNINAPVSAGGWGRGMTFRDTAGTTIIGGVGMLGNGTTPTHIYIAHGIDPYSGAIGLKIATSGAATFSSSVTATSFSGNGASLTALNGTQVTTGTVADARLSTNVSLLNGAQTISAVKTFTASPIVPTPTTDMQASTKKYVDDRITALINTSPATLDTLNELAAALGNDPNFATTMTNSLATKVDLTSTQTISGQKTFTATDTYVARIRGNANAPVYTIADRTLGGTAGDVTITRQHTNSGQTNQFHLIDMMHRRAAGTDWTTAQWYQGVGVDASFDETPSTATDPLRVWMRRDPQNQTLGFGSQNNEWLTISSTGLVGNGSGLTALNGSNISTGTVADARLSSNVMLLTGSQIISGTKTFTSTLTVAPAGTAVVQIGRTDGVASTPRIEFNSGATAVDYDTRIYAGGGTGVVGEGTLYITAATLDVTGEVDAASFVGVGTGLTALNGTNITTGTVADARIATSLARLASPAFTGTPTAPTGATSLNDTQIATTAFVKAALLAANPVGAIYFTAVNTNPGTFIGGTWVAWGTGRVPVGVDAGQTEFNTVEKTGGAKTHTLTIAEMPNHTHIQDAHGHTGGDYGHAHNFNAGWTEYGAHNWGFANGSGRTVNVPDIVLATATNYASVYINNATATNQYTGGGGAHNNLQPYITCYMWKRTA